MKTLRVIVTCYLAFFLLSCSNEEISIQNEQSLKQYLLSRKNDYVFLNTKELINSKTTIPNPIYFKSLDELDLFLNKMDLLKSTQSYNDEIIHLPPDNGGGGVISENYFRRTFYLGGFWVNMNIGFNFENCQGSNLNSWLTGFQLGVSYNHMGGALTTDNLNNKIIYYVNGVLHYNIFVEDIGTVFSENLRYSGYMNCR